MPASPGGREPWNADQGLSNRPASHRRRRHQRRGRNSSAYISAILFISLLRPTPHGPRRSTSGEVTLSSLATKRIFAPVPSPVRQFFLTMLLLIHWPGDLTGPAASWPFVRSLVRTQYNAGVFRCLATQEQALTACMATTLCSYPAQVGRRRRQLATVRWMGGTPRGLSVHLHGGAGRGSRFQQLQQQLARGRRRQVKLREKETPRSKR